MIEPTAFRRRGYATAMLGLSVQFAREQLGIERVLVTCDDDNVGSIRTIEKNGGVLDVVSGLDVLKPKRRYWIDAAVATGRPTGEGAMPPESGHRPV